VVRGRQGENAERSLEKGSGGAQGVPGGMGGAGWGRGRSGDEDRSLGKWLNVKSKKVEKAIFQARFVPPSPQNGLHRQ
jgi:hypothetical protein